MLIGIVGFAGSGKGAVSDILIRDHSFTKVSFADAVKDAVSTIFDWPRELLEGDTRESRDFREEKDEWWSKKFGYNVTPRYMLQLMGTEAGRSVFHDDIWVHVAAKRCKNIENVVLPDTRFPNEIDFIRNAGGFIIRVVRGKDPNWFDDAIHANRTNDHSIMKRKNVHYSEWAWIGQQFDYQIDNNGTMIMLESDVRHMLRVFSGPNEDFTNQKNVDTIQKVA